MHKMYRMVATGGPGGDKSGLICIRKHFEAHGYRVIIVPEIATEFFMSGLEIESDGLTNEKFQEGVLREQLRREKQYTRLASHMSGDKKLLIFERGTMDSKCYMQERQFASMIGGMGYHVVQLRDERYDAIFHLESAAVAAPQFYTTANNPARKETREQAAAKDFRTRQAWVGHPHLRVIKSEVDFNIKIQRLIHGIERVLGIPEPLEIENKYLVNLPDPNQFIREFNAIPVTIEQVYLNMKGAQRPRIRKRGYGGYFIYYLTSKHRISRGMSRETERRISLQAYRTMMEHDRDPSREIIRKTRYCFLWDGQYFELDLFHKPKRYRHLAILEIEREDISQKVMLPPLDICEEVTDSSQFYNAALAQKV